MKRIVLFYWIIVSFLFTSCGDFLKEASQDLIYAASCQDLNEILIGNGYMENKTLFSLIISENGHYFPFLHVMDDDVEEYGSGNYSVTSNSTPSVRLRPYYSWAKDVDVDVKGLPVKDPDWKRLYKHIGHLNVIISQVKEYPHDPEELRRRVMGESLFLRGAYYYLLVNLYGKPYNKETASTDLGVPLKISEFIEDKYFTRNTVKEVYDQIVEDLKNAATNLAGIKQPTIYRVNETAARTLLSRVYLYMNEWQLAIDECDKILDIGCHLWDLNDFESRDTIIAGTITQPDYFLSTKSPEILFTQGTFSMNLLMEEGSTSSGKGRYSISPELYDLYFKYENTGIEDLRASCFFAKSGKETSRYLILKSQQIAAEVDVFDSFVIRAAEVYLNKAEAQAMLEQTDAVQTIKKLLENRFADNRIPNIDGLSTENLIKFIREERRRELCLEGHRWFDLRRYAVCSKYPETKEIIHRAYLPGEISNTSMYEGSFVLKKYDEERAYVLPIPGYELEYNQGSMVDNEEREERYIYINM